MTTTHVKGDGVLDLTLREVMKRVYAYDVEFAAFSEAEPEPASWAIVFLAGEPEANQHALDTLRNMCSSDDVAATLLVQR